MEMTLIHIKYINSTNETERALVDNARMATHHTEKDAREFLFSSNEKNKAEKYSVFCHARLSDVVSCVVQHTIA